MPYLCRYFIASKSYLEIFNTVFSDKPLFYVTLKSKSPPYNNYITK